MLEPVTTQPPAHNGPQVVLYRDDWYRAVAARRGATDDKLAAEKEPKLRILFASRDPYDLHVLRGPGVSAVRLFAVGVENISTMAADDVTVVLEDSEPRFSTTG
jgi:hypothetical protein